MSDREGKIRLFVTADLAAGAEVDLSADQAHYLFNVMRQGEGARIAAFNGRDGEWIAEVTAIGKRGGRLVARTAGQPQRMPPDLWLLFAPIKKARTDFIVEKATELGVARLLPVFTRYTAAERLRTERLRAHAIEAAEQCGETWVPTIDGPVRLDAVLESWDPRRRLLYCDEARSAPPAHAALAEAASGAWAILIGPEGGFAPDEAARLRAAPYVVAATLGPRVLRADTAAAAAITLWQAALGDWR